jgi:hypothetical protein
MPPRALPAAAALALLSAVPAASAQPTLSVDLAVNSAFVWRGVTSTNRPVIDPALLLTAPAKGARVTLGAWANVEPGHYDGAHDLSGRGGARGPLVTVSQLWVEAARDVRAATLALGATRYLYPEVGGLAATYATTEVYGTAAFGGALAPSLSLYYDVQKVRGAYVELGLAHDVALPLRRVPSLALAAAVGYSAGQGVDGATGDAAYFARDGVTHVDLSVKASYVVGGLAVSPAAHVIAGRDEWARLTAPGESHRLKAWLGASVSWAGALARHRAAPAPARPDADRAETPAPDAAAREAGTPDGPTGR